MVEEKCRKVVMFVTWLTVDPLSSHFFLSFVSFATYWNDIQLTINKCWVGNSRRFVIIIFYVWATIFYFLLRPSDNAWILTLPKNGCICCVW